MNPVFLFAPDGLIRCCAIDAPESMHESSLADFGAHQQILLLMKMFFDYLIAIVALKVTKIQKLEK